MTIKHFKQQKMIKPIIIIIFNNNYYWFKSRFAIKTEKIRTNFKIFFQNITKILTKIIQNS